MVHKFLGRFEGKVVAITGDASGIGAALATRYVAERAKVLVAEFCAEEKGKAFIAQFPPNQIYFHHCDISDPVQATSVVTETIDQFGDLDIVHNNAGMGSIGQVTDLDPKEWNRIMQVNLNAPFYICKAAITEMKKHTEKKTRGVIINTISTAGIIGDQDLACYSASKAGLANLTRTMASDHAKDGIRINGVAPGWTKTPMSAPLSVDPKIAEEFSLPIPMRRGGEPEELAAVMMFLASEDASYVTGAVWNVDGGLLSITRMRSLADVMASVGG